MSKPAKDICQYCYTFANKHKILTEQEQQQQQQSDDDGGDGNDDNDSTSNDESNVVDDDNDVDDDDVDDVDGDDLAVVEKMIQNVNLKATGAASTTAREAKEKLIIQCKRHIDMARAQRVVYQTLEKNARDDVRNSVPHSWRRITVSADFGQNMACPCYNCKQPGCTSL